MKIADKIRLSLFIVALIVATIISFATYTIAKMNLEKTIFDHLRTAAQSRAGHIETFLKEDAARMKIMAESDSIEAALKAVNSNHPDSQEFIEKSLSQIKKFMEASEESYEIFVIDPKGKIVLSTDKSNIGLDRAANIYFVEGTKGVYIKDAYYSRTTKKNSISISAPILDDETGGLLGVLVSRIKLGGLNKIVTNSTGMGETGEIYLINKYGYMITPSRFIKDTFLKEKVDTVNSRNAFDDVAKGLHAIHKEEAEVFNFFDYRNVEVIGTHAHIPQMNWVLLAKIDETEALAPLAHIRYACFFILLFTLILASLMGNLVSGTISKPIIKLHEGTEIIGQGNFDYKVGTDTKDEVGQLSRAFDKMTDDLKKTTASRNDLLREIDERKKAERLAEKVQRQLWQSEKMAAVGQLSAGVAHEVKNPLATILLSIESMEDILPDLSEKSQKRIGMIKNAAERANAIVNGLLDFSRQADLKLRIVSLQNVIEGTIVLTRNIDKAKNINIRKEFGEEDKFLIQGDNVLLQQALLNLFTNAIDAMNDGGTLGIKLSRNADNKKESVVIEISDTGTGMPQEIVDKIFDPFFTTKEPGKGTGLGLSTVYTIIEKHKGDIKVESKINEGTKFIIELPLSQTTS